MQKGRIMNEMINKKCSPQILELIRDQALPDPLDLIVQTVDGLKDADRQTLEIIGGEIVDDLWIIKGFSAKIPAKGLEMLVLSDRVTLIHFNGEVSG